MTPCLLLHLKLERNFEKRSGVLLEYFSYQYFHSPTIFIKSLFSCPGLFEPRREKTGLRGFRPGPTQTGLYKLRKELEA